MSNQSSLKVLTVGPAVGSFRELFAKIKAIDAKHGKFDICLCVGDFFGPPAEDGTISDDLQSLLNGDLEAPMECYIMQGPHALPGPVIEKFAKTSGDICKNVFLLSKSAIVTTTHGIRIASLGGGYQPMAYAASETALGFTSPYFSKQTVEKLIANSSSNSSMSTKAKDYTSLASIASNSSASNLVDIFVSTAWPSAITQCANSPPPSMGAPPLDVIVRSIKPRYHFVPGPGQPMTFWEREPYVWEEDTRVSRFVALGAFGGEQGPGKKQRWFYAFTLAPISTANTASIPPNATDNPFNISVSGQKRGSDGMESGHIWENVSSHPKKRAKASKVENDGKPPEGYSCKICQSGDHFITDCPDRQKPSDDYVCKICNEKGHFVRDCPTKHAVGDTGGRKPRAGYMCRACNSELHYLDDCPVANATGRNGGQTRGGGKKRQPIKEIQPDECWFCLSNPNLAKHLITAVGNECYVTLPKGQLIPTGPNAKSKTSLPATPGGGHVLIVPIAHFPTLASASGESASAVLDEVDRYKSALKTFYAQYDADAVFVETARVSAKGGHAHVQVIPVPHSLSSRVRDAFTTMGAQRGVNFAEDTEGALAACKEGVRGYFRVDLPDNSTMVHMIREGGGFNLQFGREVMAQILGVEERADWRACAQTEDQEKEDVAAFKAAFASFDLSS